MFGLRAGNCATCNLGLGVNMYVWLFFAVFCCHNM